MNSRPRPNGEAGPLGLLVRSLRWQFRASLYVNAYYLMATSAVRSLTGLPFWILAARLYPPADVGLASALISAITLLATLSSLGVEVALIRFLPGTEDQNALVNSSLTLVALCSSVVAVLSVLSVPWWSRALAPLLLQPSFAIAFSVFAVGGTLSVVIDQVFVAHRNAAFTFLKNAISSTLKIPLPLLLAATSGALALLLSVGLPVLLALAVSLLCFLPRLQTGYLPRFSFPKRVLADLLRYSFGNHAANVLGAVPSALFPVMVLAVLGTETNAFFFAAWTLAQPLFLVSSAISYSLFAEGSHRSDSLSRIALDALRVSFLILAVGTAAVFLLGARLLLVFGQPYSEHATTLLRLFSLAALPISVKLIGIAAYRVRKQLSRILTISILDAALSVTAVRILMGTLGLSGVGLGLLGSQVVVALVVLSDGCRTTYFGADGEA